MDLYVILGLRQGASESDIKRAYKRLARRFHPDINPGDRTAELRFRQILEAYETLIDPDRRIRYESGGGAVDVTVAQSGFEGFDFSQRGTDHSGTFGDLFAEVLSDRGARGAGPERGADLHEEVTLPFEAAFGGLERAVAVTRRETCRACAGTGVAHVAETACRLCQGAGTQRSVRGHMVFTRRCSACAGSGQQRPRACEPCGGSDVETRAELVTVPLPAGVADGDRMRVAGKGNAGVRGGPPGDLLLSIRVGPHPRFRREGLDLHVMVPVAIHEAALGARIEVPSPAGPVKMKVPAGTQSGQRFRLRERGVPSPRDGQHGDLVVEVQLVLPRLLDERSKALLREFGAINGESVREQL